MLTGVRRCGRCLDRYCHGGYGPRGRAPALWQAANMQSGVKGSASDISVDVGGCDVPGDRSERDASSLAIRSCRATRKDRKMCEN